MFIRFGSGCLSADGCAAMAMNWAWVEPKACVYVSVCEFSVICTLFMHACMKFWDLCSVRTPSSIAGKHICKSSGLGDKSLAPSERKVSWMCHVKCQALRIFERDRSEASGLWMLCVRFGCTRWIRVFGVRLDIWAEWRGEFDAVATLGTLSWKIITRTTE